LGVSARYDSPQPIGQERKGTVVAVAYGSDHRLYHLERYNVRSHFWERAMRESQLKLHGHPGLKLKTALFNSTTGQKIMAQKKNAQVDFRFDDITFHNGFLYAVTSPEGNMDSAVVINPLTEEVMMKPQDNVRQKRDYPTGYLRLFSSPEGLHVYGGARDFLLRQTTRGPSAKRIFEPSAKKRKIFGPDFLVRDQSSANSATYSLLNVMLDHPTHGHSFLISDFEYSNDILAQWHLQCNGWVERTPSTGVVYMACIVNGHLVVGTVDKEGGNIRALANKMSALDGKRDLHPEVIVPGAFKVGEPCRRNNPMIALPSAKALDDLIREAADVEVA
jgi:hypothetical protein